MLHGVTYMPEAGDEYLASRINRYSLDTEFSITNTDSYR